MQNYNQAYSTNFRFEFTNNPTLNYFMQSVAIPTVSANRVQVGFQNSVTYMQDTNITFDPLNIQFLVDEDYKNYIYIKDWMMKSAEKEKPPMMFQDATLHVLSNKKTNNIRFKFYGLFPLNVSAGSYESSVSDTNALVGSATFSYQYFEIES